jgi:hypothetical protein
LIDFFFISIYNKNIMAGYNKKRYFIDDQGQYVYIKKGDEDVYVYKKFYDGNVGDEFEGGVVVYLCEPYQPFKNGLIAVKDWDYDSLGTSWGCKGTSIGATGISIGDGKNNTEEILRGNNACTESGIAAKLCDDFDYEGYTDWYLPSVDELKEIYKNKSHLTTADFYWSSSEENADNAYYVNFNNGDTVNSLKDSTFFNVKAVRSF